MYLHLKKMLRWIFSENANTFALIMDCFQIEFHLTTLYKLEQPHSLTIYIPQIKKQTNYYNISSAKTQRVAALNSTI